MQRIPAHFDGNLQGMSEIETRVNLNKAKKLKIFSQNQIDIHQEQTHKMGHMQKSDSQLDSTTWNTIKRKQ